MGEKVLSIEGYDPLAIFGTHENKLEYIRLLFPKLKIVVRGEMIKLIGLVTEIKRFEIYFDAVLMHFDNYQSINESDLARIAETDFNGFSEHLPNDILVHGRNGNLIKARTENQRKMVESVSKNDLTLAIGPAGTGKNLYCSSAGGKSTKKQGSETSYPGPPRC